MTWQTPVCTACEQVLSAPSDNAGGECGFEIRGLLPPWVLHRVLCTLRDHHEEPAQASHKLVRLLAAS